jgi:hypothetical protein
MVPTPTSTASVAARRRETWRRASSPVTQNDEPVRVAILPSAVMAYFSVTKGRWLPTHLKYASLSRRAASAPSPTLIAIPAAASACMPCPLTQGLGSSIAACTSRTPAAINASVQGGVRPTCEHGSSVT